MGKARRHVRARAGAHRALGRIRVRRLAFLLALAALAPALVLGGSLPPAGSVRHAARADGVGPPDVVVVLTDDQRAGTLSRMPFVWNRLRERGVRFPNAMVPTSLCCSSRASLLTGRYARHTRVYSNAPPEGGWPTFHDRGLEKATLATLLHARGYRTGLFGKYLNGFADAPRGEIPPGWDQFVSFRGVLDGAYYDYGLTDGTWHGSRPADYSTDVFRRRAVRFIRSTPSDKPLFLYFSPWGPHRPFTPAPRHVDAWKGRLPSYRPPSVTEDVSDKPSWVRVFDRVPQEQVDRTQTRQQETLMAVDEAVAALSDALEDTGRLHNTLFVYLSDNGLMWGDHHLDAKKNLPYRFATEIPMVLRWDGHIPAGSTDWRLALNVDVASTIASATGSPMATDGLDLRGPATRDGFALEAAAWRRLDSLPKHPSYCGYRTRRWMYVRYADGTEELYSYARDPWEVRNRARDPAFRAQRLQMRAKAVASCVPLPPGFTW